MADEQTLRDVGLSHQKARTIRALAEQADDGLLEPDKLAAMTDDEIQANLVAVPGIGPSTVQRFLLHYLRRPDVFLAGDQTVREAAECAVATVPVVRHGVPVGLCVGAASARPWWCGVVPRRRD